MELTCTKLLGRGVQLNLKGVQFSIQAAEFSSSVPIFFKEWWKEQTRKKFIFSMLGCFKFGKGYFLPVCLDYGAWLRLWYPPCLWYQASVTKCSLLCPWRTRHFLAMGASEEGDGLHNFFGCRLHRCCCMQLEAQTRPCRERILIKSKVFLLIALIGKLFGRNTKIYHQNLVLQPSKVFKPNRELSDYFNISTSKEGDLTCNGVAEI